MGKRFRNLTNGGLTSSSPNKKYSSQPKNISRKKKLSPHKMKKFLVNFMSETSKKLDDVQYFSQAELENSYHPR